MKFAEHLAAHITPEWRKQYISYEEMKAMLYTAVEQAPSAEVTEESAIIRYYARFDEQFFRVSDKELEKINTFFSEKLAEATRKYNTLKSDLQASTNSSTEDQKNKTFLNFIPKLNVPARKTQDLKLAFSEFYLSLILLQNYQNLNFTGFRKILKKHDKLLNRDNGAKWREENVDVSPFNTAKDIDKLIQEVESTFTSELEQGDRARAMKRLRVPPLGEAQSPWTTFKVGLFSGALIVLLVTILITAVFPGEPSEPKPVSHFEQPVDAVDLDVTLRLFRAPLLIFTFLFCIGFNIYGWRSSGVNHVLIFEIDPRNHLTEQHLIEIAAIFGVIWALCVLGFLYAPHIGISPYYIPLLLLVTMIIFMINPSKSFHHEARFWLLKKLGRVICAPLVFVQFADFWLGDQLNTLARTLVDFEHTICFYLNHVSWEPPQDNFYALTLTGARSCASDFRWSSAIVQCFPAWWRFAQCLRRYRDTREAFPHLVNALKYATTFFVVTFSYLYEPDQYDQFSNPWFYMFLISRISSSCFVLWWDLVMDWGLFGANSGEYRFLREEMVYSSPYYYYIAIVEDVILRFSWIITFTLSEIKHYRPHSWSGSSEVMITIMALLEVFRRFIWNFLRLENEHLNNCGKFRAVRDISIIPLDASDQAQIVKMMDDEDGVVNRRKKKAAAKVRKLDQRPLLNNESTPATGESADEEANYLTVTSVDLKNWFKGITGHKNVNS